MINHFDIATEGLRKDHRWIARLGFFSIEVTPVPPPTDTSGGGGTVIGAAAEYYVTVRLVYKGTEYEQTRVVTASGLKGIEKVIVIFRGISKLWERTVLSAKFVGSYLRQLATINMRYFDKKDSTNDSK